MMWTRTVDKKELLGFLYSEKAGVFLEPRQISSIDELQEPGVGELRVIWGENPKLRLMPSIVVVPENERRDLLAWVLTYIPHLRPFTAYSRVLTLDEARNALKRRQSASLGSLDKACAALILGEAASHAEGKKGPTELTRNACASTYSFSISRAIALGASEKELSLITRRWSRAREITGQPRLRLSTQDLQVPWEVLHSLIEVDRQVKGFPEALQILVEACRDIHNENEIGEVIWKELIGRQMPDVFELPKKMNGPREERVQVFEDAIKSLLLAPGVTTTTKSFVCGYLASRLAPGSLEYLSLVLPLGQIASTVPFWYCLCSGLSEGSDVYRYAEGLALRAIRDVLLHDSVLESPRCDLALSELEIILEAEGGLRGFRSGNPGNVEVELAPCIVATLRSPLQKDGEPQGDLFHTENSSIKEIYPLLDELTWAMDRVGSISRRLRGHLNPGNGSKTKRKK